MDNITDTLYMVAIDSVVYFATKQGLKTLGVDKMIEQVEDAVAKPLGATARPRQSIRQEVMAFAVSDLIYLYFEDDIVQQLAGLMGPIEYLPVADAVRVVGLSIIMTLYEAMQSKFSLKLLLDNMISISISLMVEDYVMKLRNEMMA
jgi:hypothetical protein